MMVIPLIADDPKIAEFFDNAKAKGNFLATYDPVAYQYADVIIVDINLDVQKQSYEKGGLKDFDVNLNGFKAPFNLSVGTAEMMFLFLLRRRSHLGLAIKSSNQ